MSGGFYDLSTTGGVAKTLFLDGKGLRHSPKSKNWKQDASKQTVWWTIRYCQWIYLDENKICRCDGRLLLWLVLRCDGWFCFGLMETKRMRGQSWIPKEIEFESSFCEAGEKTQARCLVIEDRPRQKSHRLFLPGEVILSHIWYYMISDHVESNIHVLVTNLVTTK